MGTVSPVRNFRFIPAQLEHFSWRRLAGGGLYSEPQSIVIKAASAEDATISLALSPTQLTARVGEQLNILSKLSTTDSRVKTQVELPTVAGVEFQPLQQLKTANEISGIQLVEHQLGWALTAKQAGQYEIELPPVMYRLHGRNIRRFYLPKLNLNIRPLPAYVPAHVPVGALTVNNYYAPLQSDSAWSVVVETDARLPYGLPVFRAELASISGVAIDQIIERIELEQGAEKILTRFHYRVPLPEILLGEGREVRLNYYDLEKQRVEALVHRLPAAWKIPQWLATLVGLMIASIIFYLLFVGWRVWNEYHRKRTLRRQIMNCETPHQLRQILLVSSGHRALADWADCFMMTPKLAVARSLVKRLNEACFQQPVAESRLQQIKLEAAEIVA